MCHLPGLVVLVFIAGAALPTQAMDYEVGDLVVAVRDVDLRVKRGGRVVVTDSVFPGVTMRVKSTSGRWLWVSNGVPGWINKRDVIPLEQAIDFFTEKIEQSPSVAKWRYARAVAWTNKGELDIAIADYTDLIKLRPSPPFFHVRGICYLTKGDYDKAVQDFNEAIRLDPQSGRYYNSRAEAWYEKGEYDRSISDVNEAIRLEPNLASAYKNRGRAYQAQGDIGLAIEDYKKSMQLDPNYEVAHTHFAWLLATSREQRHRDGAMAVKFAERACQLTNWEDPSCMSALAAAHAEEGNFDEALRWERKAQDLYTPKQKEKWAFLEELYESGQPYRQAGTDVERRN